MMNNEFNLELAKRGAVVIASVNQQPAIAKFLAVKQDGRALFIYFINECENERWHYGFVQPPEYNGLRMATQEECDKAGVEYIEPPLSHDEMVALREENSRLQARVEELKRLFHEAISNTKKG